jgi:hypothetical protein
MTDFHSNNDYWAGGLAVALKDMAAAFAEKVAAKAAKLKAAEAAKKKKEEKAAAKAATKAAMIANGEASRFTGVYFDRRWRSWKASIKIDQKPWVLRNRRAGSTRLRQRGKAEPDTLPQEEVELLTRHRSGRQLVG